MLLTQSVIDSSLVTAELIIADFNPDCHNDHYIFTDLMIKRISDIKIKTGVKIDFGGSYNDLVKSYMGWSWAAGIDLLGYVP